LGRAVQRTPDISQPGNGQELVPPDQFINSVGYNEFCRTKLNDVFHSVGGTFAMPWGAGSIGIHRFPSNVPFDRDDLDRIRPHAAAVGHVLRARGEIAAHRRKSERLLSTLNAIGQAVIVVRGDGLIEEVNAAADVVLRRADALVVRDGRLLVRAHASGGALAERISEATSPSEPRASVLPIARGADIAPYLLTITPLAGRATPSAAMILFRDPDVEDSTLCDRLRSLYGLTPAEADIAVAVSRGLLPADIAQSRGVQPNTLKTQLRSLAAKMGVTRLSAIASLVTRLPSVGRSKL
jgi:DNA-binding CsgD family transcriptional regulator